MPDGRPADRAALRTMLATDILVRLLDRQLMPRASVLEIRCGEGRLSNLLGMTFGRMVVGTDDRPTLLALAAQDRDRMSIRNTRFVPIDQFQASADAFDIVIVNDVLADPEMAPALLERATHALRRGGHAVLSYRNRFGSLLSMMGRGRDGGGAEEPRGACSMNAILDLLARHNLAFVSSIPAIGDEEVADDYALFEEHSTGSYLDRLSTELECWLSEPSGRFVVTGRKR